MHTAEKPPAETRLLADEELAHVSGGVDWGAAAELYILTFCVGVLPWGETGTLNKLPPR